jgi:hypothetical protein
VLAIVVECLAISAWTRLTFGTYRTCAFEANVGFDVMPGQTRLAVIATVAVFPWAIAAIAAIAAILSTKRGHRGHLQHAARPVHLGRPDRPGAWQLFRRGRSGGVAAPRVDRRPGSYILMIEIYENRRNGRLVAGKS